MKIRSRLGSSSEVKKDILKRKKKIRMTMLLVSNYRKTRSNCMHTHMHAHIIFVGDEDFMFIFNYFRNILNFFLCTLFPMESLNIGERRKAHLTPKCLKSQTSVNM